MASGQPIPHLLLVGARPEVIGALVGLPLALTTVQQQGGDTRDFEKTVALQVLGADISDVDALQAAVAGAHAARPVDAVLCLTEVALYAASVVGEALSARVNPAACVQLTLDKSAMRSRLAERGLDRTEHLVCTGFDQARDFAARFPDGVILKPIDGNGGTGVSLVREPAELEAAWAWTASAANGGAVLAERFLTGREVSVETISVAGQHRVLAITAKHTTGAPYFVEIGHDVPASLTDTERAGVLATASGALDAVGHTWGPCHTELMLSGDQASVVEINTRMGGDRIWELVQLATGVSLPAASAMALGYGWLPVPDPAAVRGAAVRFLQATPGRVLGVTGTEAARATAGVVRVGDLVGPGDLVQPLVDYRDRAGYVLAAGADANQAVRAAEAGAAHIRVNTSSAGYDQRVGSPTVLRAAVR